MRHEGSRSTGWTIRIPVKAFYGFVLAVIAAAGAGAPASAGRISMTAGGFFNVPVTSLKESRFKTVIKQQYDYSCGSAALATLLTYHYENPTTEEEIFRAMFEAGDQELIRTKGFSLLDMKTYLENTGYRADGFQVELDVLEGAGIPAIVLIETRGYRHFVVIKGIRGDEVVVGDPALGTRVYDRADFDALRVGKVVFVIRNRREVASTHFNRKRDWSVRAKAPFGTALSRQSLASFTLMLPGRNEF